MEYSPIGSAPGASSSLGLFVVASAECDVAPTTVTLVIARIVQGVGAALAVPASLALLRAAFPDPADRARAIGVWDGIAGVAAAAGPILGDGLVTAVSWRMVLLVYGELCVINLYFQQALGYSPW